MQGAGRIVTMGNRKRCQCGTCKTSVQLSHRPKIYSSFPISIPMEPVIGFHCYPNPLLLYCSGETVHIGKSRSNRSQPGNSPTDVFVTFDIKDTHKTLQPPDLIFWAFLRCFWKTAPPYLPEQLWLDIFQKECLHLAHSTCSVAKIITYPILSLLQMTATSILKFMLIQE